MTNRIPELWKRVLSFNNKRLNTIEYPLQYNKQEVGENDNAGTSIKALSTNEPGDSNDDPDMRFNFASTTKMEQLVDIAIDFFPRILGYDFFGIFVSDLSSVFDFGIDEEEIIKKINAAYNLQLSRLGDGIIVDLLSDIKEARKTSG